MAQEPLSDDSSSSRESIRKQLASANGDEEGSGNLLICFMNEALVDEEDTNNVDQVKNKPNQLDIDQLTAAYIAKNNISRRKNHVIIPLTPIDDTNKDFEPNHTDKAKNRAKAKTNNSDCLAGYLRKIRIEAREKLKRAKDEAKSSIDSERQSRPLFIDLEKLFGNSKCFSLAAKSRRLSRRLLTDMNIAHLQVILNFLLSRIEQLNEDLVQSLLDRDSLIREQDALLTDIEDITNGINGSA